MANNRANSLWEGFLESRKQDRIADYVGRGRRYGPLNDDDLMAEWWANLKSMADAPREPSFTAAFDDAEAELALRNIDPPCEEAVFYFDRYAEATDAYMREIRRDPELLAALKHYLANELMAFDDAIIWSN